MKRIILGIATIFVINMNAQTAAQWGFWPTIPTVIPPPPESASLAKFVETPVSYFSGSPDVSIPFYTIEQDGLQLPISISYNTRGIQVAETASNVGLGWALNAGGVITRQIRDFEDEATRGYLTGNWSATFATDGNTRWSIYPYVLPDIVGTAPPHDMEPDMYILSCAGLSAKFIITQDKEVVSQTKEDLKIVPTFYGNVVSYFTVWDASGNKYVFNDMNEYQHTRNYRETHTNSLGTFETDKEINYVQTWYLDQITTAKNKTINFVYSSDTNQSESKKDDHITHYQKSDDINNSDPEKGPEGVTSYWARRITYQKRLLAIHFDGGKVLFSKVPTEREDLQGAHALKEIEIQNYSGHVIKKFAFEYHYTHDPSTLNIINNLTLDAHARKRLMLSKVIEENGVNDLEYKFTYDPQVLPSRHATSVDNWGYYNGVQTNGHYLDYGHDAYGRMVDTLKTKASSLKRIDYPTGGYTEFEFEQHRAERPKYADSLYLAPNNPGLVKYVHFNTAFAGTPNSGVTLNNGVYYMTFTIGGSHKVSLNQIVRVPDINCPDHTDSNLCSTKIWIRKNGTLHKRLFKGSGYVVALEPGTYEISVKPGSDSGEFGYMAEVHLSWLEQIVDDKYEIVVGGQRIKTITKGEGGTIHSVTRYKYTKPGGGSSGRIYCVPSYIQSISPLLPGGIGSATQSSGSPFSNANISSIGYSVVTEEKIGEGKTGKTEYYFTNFYDTGLFYQYPHQVPNDMGWARGKPWSIKHFEFKNNAYRPVKTILNYYTYYGDCSAPVPDPTIIADPDQTGTPDGYSETIMMPQMLAHDKSRVPLYRFRKYVNDLEDLGFNEWNNSNSFRVAYFYGGSVQLTKSTETDYFYDAADVPQGNFSKTTRFSYAKWNHHQQKTKTEEKSDGTEIITDYTYPYDASMSMDLIALGMRSREMVNTILEMHVTNSSSQKIFGQRTRYQEITAQGEKIYVPEIVSTYKGDNPYEDHIKYTLYDNKGNLLESERKDGMKTSYIWGYGGNYPVAQIENAAYNIIDTNVIAAIHQYAGNALTSALNDLRDDASLAEAMITTCTYIPLVGMTSLTDPKRIKTTYEYDDFGRLVKVRDNDGNILSKNEYHYRLTPP